jgi:hypothetical protein
MSKSIRVEILGDASSFKRELDGATSNTQKFSLGLNKMKFAALGAASGGVAVLGDFLVGSVKAAIAAQQSTARLDQAFKNAGLAADTYSQQIGGAEAAGRNLGFTDEQTKQSLGSLLSATKDVGKSIQDMGVAMDLARFKHIDLTDATKMLTMAMTGSQRAVKQLGITISPVTSAVDALKASNIDLSTATGRAELAHAKLIDKMATGQAVIAATSGLVKGQGEAFAGTAGGGMEKFHAQLEHLKVAVGDQLLPALTKFLDKLIKFTDYLNNNLAPALKDISDRLDKFKWAVDGVQWIMSHSLNIFVLVKFELKALSVAIDGVSFAFDKLKGAASAFKGVGSAIAGAANTVAGAFWSAAHAVEALIGALGRIHVPHISLPSIGSLIPHASGGRVSAGKGYLVGERGPEMFVSGSSGSIIPNFALAGGGGGGVNVTVNVHGALMGSSVPEVATTIRNELLRMQKRNGNLGWT